MYGLPKNIDLDFLKGKRLVQICISSNQVIMRFDDDISISIESVIKLYKGKEVWSYEVNTSINTDFINLLGNLIVDYTHYESGTLVLYFDHGSKIELNDDSENYESYQIIGNGQTIIV